MPIEEVPHRGQQRPTTALPGSVRATSAPTAESGLSVGAAGRSAVEASFYDSCQEAQRLGHRAHRRAPPAVRFRRLRHDVRGCRRFSRETQGHASGSTLRERRIPSGQSGVGYRERDCGGHVRSDDGLDHLCDQVRSLGQRRDRCRQDLGGTAQGVPRQDRLSRIARRGNRRARRAPEPDRLPRYREWHGEQGQSGW